MVLQWEWSVERHQAAASGIDVNFFFISEAVFNHQILVDFPHLPLVPRGFGNDKDSYMDFEFGFHEDSTKGRRCCLWTPVYAWNEEADLIGHTHAPEGTTCYV